MKHKRRRAWIGRAAATVLGLLLAAGASHAEPVARVGLLIAGEEDHPFWGAVADFAEAVAEDLDIDLRMSYSRENSYSIKRNGLKLLDQLGESGYFLSGYYRSVTLDFLEKAEESGIKTVVFNTDILASDRETVGEPRGQYKHWIAHMRPDEVQAGYDLGAILARRANRQLEAERLRPLDILAITGPLSSYSYEEVTPLRQAVVEGERVAGETREDSAVSMQRLSGLDRYTRSEEGVNMLGYLDAYWLPEQAHDLTDEALKKFDVDTIWSASDAMALAALEAAREEGRKPGEDVLGGGFDWSEAGLQAVADGTLGATMGGHFMEAGWALVLIHDYARGKDFSEATGVNIVTGMSAITGDNIERYLKYFGDGQWNKLDFKKFSLIHNEALTDYDFSLDVLLEQME